MPDKADEATSSRCRSTIALEHLFAEQRKADPTPLLWGYLIRVRAQRWIISISIWTVRAEGHVSVFKDSLLLTPSEPGLFVCSRIHLDVIPAEEQTRRFLFRVAHTAYSNQRERLLGRGCLTLPAACEAWQLHCSQSKACHDGEHLGKPIRSCDNIIISH